jgi:hypothetical protein
MTDVSRNEFQVVKDGSCCDLQVGVGEDIAGLFQIGTDHPEDTRS